jgi:mannitol/fructose-specific phosphotransferase system IIA component (Ntr-type)
MPLTTIDSAFVKLDLQAVGSEAAILETAALADSHPDMADFARFHAELLEREKLSSTASGSGVAFPHARTDAVRNIVLAVGRSKAGIPFGPDGVPVHFVVVIGVPKPMVREYLGIAGRLARLFRDAGKRARLLETESEEEFAALLRETLPGGY